MYFCNSCNEDDKKYFIELICYDGTLTPLCGICHGIYTKPEPEPEPEPKPKKNKVITTKSIINNVLNDKIKKTKKR
jgi:hypothetical protein